MDRPVPLAGWVYRSVRPTPGMELELFGFRTDIDASLIEEPEAEVRRQVDGYERGTRRTFDLTVALPDGFLGSVMGAMLDIPYGEARTYGELAADLDTAPVAVGQACGRNPVGIVVPCHRVVGHDSLGGYSARGGVAMKRALLRHEGWDGVQS